MIVNVYLSRYTYTYECHKKYCYDYTNLGHWSGTGIVTFNDNKYKFNKDALDKCDNLNIFRHYY
jgi:hypothetical protein